VWGKGEGRSRIRIRNASQKGKINNKGPATKREMQSDWRHGHQTQTMLRRAGGGEAISNLKFKI